jgi:hypothetical protein
MTRHRLGDPRCREKWFDQTYPKFFRSARRRRQNPFLSMIKNDLRFHLKQQKRCDWPKSVSNNIYKAFPSEIQGHLQISSVCGVQQKTYEAIGRLNFLPRTDTLWQFQIYARFCIDILRYSPYSAKDITESLSLDTSNEEVFVRVRENIINLRKCNYFHQ